MDARSELTAAAIDPDLLARASAWMARLWSEDASEQDRAACLAWRAAHPDHERAWSRLLHVQQKFAEVPRDIARRALFDADKPRRSRRGALKMMGAFATLGIAGYAARRTDTWQRVAADHATGVGEIRSLLLPDGSRVVLDTESAIDLAFTHAQRRIVLRAGEISIETAHDNSARPRPLFVATEQGTVHALGTRFTVRQGDGVSEVAVYQGAVRVQPVQADSMALRLDAGERTVFSAARAQAPMLANEAHAAWTQGRLVAASMRVADLIATLARYRTGVLHCDSSAAELRVTGIFPLHDIDRALSNLALGVPVEVIYRNRWWVTVRAKPSAATTTLGS